MDNGQKGNLLADKDRQSTRDVITSIHNCRNRRDLKDVFETRILPLLGAQSALYAWKDPDTSKLQLIDCVNIPKNEIQSIQEFIVRDPMAKYLLTHSQPVIARDIDLGEHKDSLPMDPFLGEKLPAKKGYEYFSIAHPGMITLALRESSLGAGIHRHLPCDKPWTLRELRILEKLRPHLQQAIKTILLREELEKHKSLAETLADSPTAIALLTKDTRISFCNKAFENLMHIESGEKLPEELTQVVHNSTELHETDSENSASQPEGSLYKMPQGDFRMTVSRLITKDEGDMEQDEFLLLQMKPAIGQTPQMNQVMIKAGLTKREMETCSLIREGANSREIAKQLYISPNTVRTHLNKIYDKLGVHSRAQLVATLHK